jgi:Ca-activated chloride channel family protein
VIGSKASRHTPGMTSRLPLSRLSSTTLLAFALAACSDDGGSSEDDYGGDELVGEDEAVSADSSDWGSDGGETSGAGSDEGLDEGDGADDSQPETGTDTTGETDTTTGEPACNDVDPVVLYLSPDDSNSSSSPAQIEDRVLDENGHDIGDISIRPWEFMNYYGFPYEAAADGSLAIYGAAQPIEGVEGRYDMQLAVASETMTSEDRPPMNVTLVMDTSGSMAGEAIELLRETGKVIAAQLRVGDTVSMVEWDTQTMWTLAGYQVTGPSDPVVLDAIDALEAGGGTDLNAGLVSGYELAQAVYDAGAINRLVLISDGGANAGVTEADLIAENAAFGGADGIYLVGVGVASSADSYHDALMDTVTDVGKGASVFVGNSSEAQRMFGEQFLATMAISARDVQVELTLPPGFEIVKFSGEEFSGDPKEIEPQHIAPNDAIVFYQQVETCAPELVTADTPVGVKLTWLDVWTFEPQELSQEWTFGELFGSDPGLMRKGAAVLAYADALIAYKDALDGEAQTAALQPAIDAVTLAQAALPDDVDLQRIASVLANLSAP